MFGIGMTELLVIFVIGLLVLGPKRLPELARSLGKGLAEFRRASMDMRKEFMDVAEEVKITPPSLEESAADMPPQAGVEVARKAEGEAKPDLAGEGALTDPKPDPEGAPATRTRNG